MGAKVIVVGGGIAGLTAAHELIDRGFDVHVYERRLDWGGKAASRLAPSRAPTAEEEQRWRAVSLAWLRAELAFGLQRTGAPYPGKEEARAQRVADIREECRSREEALQQAIASSRDGVPREHGFRFFPGWYRHLPDTMKRIPFRGRRNEYAGGSVYENLVPVEENLVAWTRRDPVAVPLHLPATFNQLSAAARFVKEMGRAGVGTDEALEFVSKLGKLLVADVATHQELQQVTWWDFLGAANRSRAFQEFTRATTMTMVAAKAEEVNASTIGKLALRIFLQGPSSRDCVLNGPTHRKFIEPWTEYLASRGVVFHTGFELESLGFAQGEPKLESVALASTAGQMLARLHRTLRSIHYEVAKLLAKLKDVESLRADKRKAAAQELEAQLKGDWERARDDCLSAKALLAHALDVMNHPLHTAQEVPRRHRLLCLYPLLELEVAAIWAWRKEVRTLSGSDENNKSDTLPYDKTAIEILLNLPPESPLFSETIRDRENAERKQALNEVDEYLSEFEVKAIDVQPAAYFILALPVEQLAYYVNRSGTLRARAPETASIVPLSGFTSWMSGIQFYLREPLDLVRGHLVGIDAPWALTAIEQTQFWKETPLAPEIKAVLSVDIGDWSKRGEFVKKPAWNCTHEEVAKEVWSQLKSLINPEDRQPRLRDDMLFQGSLGVSGNLQQGINFNLDESVVDLLDRRKQDAYERARGVALGQADAMPTDLSLYMWGRRNSYNLEPILINRVGAHALRPDVSTGIQNMFLAGDFVRTETDLACMEGANEAARRAVNALLATAGSRMAACEVWDFAALPRAAEQLAVASGAVAAAKPLATVARAGADIATGLLGTAVRIWSDALRGAKE